MANESIPYYEPGQQITAYASAGLTGKRFAKVSGNRRGTGSPGLDTGASGYSGVYQAGVPAAGQACFGVIAQDAASGALVTILGSGHITPVTCAANITAGAQVEVDNTGKVITLATGIAVGMAMTGATSGGDAEIKVY